MNPQDVLNQQIRMLIGDLQVNLMMANARIQELEGQINAMTAAVENEVDAPAGPHPAKRNGKAAEAGVDTKAAKT